MRNKRTIGLSVLMILIMIGMAILPGMAAVDFTANVTSTQNTALEAGDVAFGDITAGTTDEAFTVFTLNNTGNIVANVDAAFTTDVGGVYGFTNTTYVIAGTNFSLTENVSASYNALLATSGDQRMSDDVPANTAEAWDAQLVIPAGQTAALYTGTVEITFS